MTQRTNAFGQPIGAAVPDWEPRPVPPGEILRGQYCRLEPVTPARHADDLYDAYRAAGQDSSNEAGNARDWTYLPLEPFTARAPFDAYVQAMADASALWHYAIVDAHDGKAIGTLALMRADTANGSIEVGFVVYSPRLKHTRAATEAQFLLMQHVFDELGYRRYEWKCDSLNAPSRRAAVRLGFQFEGIFRNAVVYKGRNRDTAWYAIIDRDWPALRERFIDWLAPANFDDQGAQRRRLSADTPS